MLGRLHRAGIRVQSLLHEYGMGITTRGTSTVDAPDAVHYATISYGGIWTILEHLKLAPDDIFVDLGCGKGRVVCCASRFNVKAVVGVDLDSGLCGMATTNAARLRGRLAPITIVNSSVQEFDFAGATALYLFNPFGAATLREVLSSLERSWRADPRRLRIAYVFPVHAWLLEACDWLERESLWEVRDDARFRHDVSFWRSRQAGASGEGG